MLSSGASSGKRLRDADGHCLQIAPWRHCAPEPARQLETTASLDVRKLRFEVNRMELPMGVEGTFGMVKHPGASLAVPVLADGRVVLLRQYRFAVATRLLEFPAGTLDPGETPLSTMQRELQEEAGYSATRWDAWGPLACPDSSVRRLPVLGP